MQSSAKRKVTSVCGIMDVPDGPEYIIITPHLYVPSILAVGHQLIIKHRAALVDA